MHYTQLFPIYGSLYQDRDKKKKVKNHKRLKPLAGVALIILSAVPGLAGFHLLYADRWVLSGLLLCVSGALVLCGANLALSEPETKQEK